MLEFVTKKKIGWGLVNYDLERGFERNFNGLFAATAALHMERRGHWRFDPILLSHVASRDEHWGSGGAISLQTLLTTDLRKLIHRGFLEWGLGTKNEGPK